jgi:hypothetical protein
VPQNEPRWEDPPQNEPRWEDPRWEDPLGKAPKAYAYDRAGWSEANVAELKQLGVRAVGLAHRGKAKWQVAGKAKNKLVSERAQVEGSIGSLKSHKYGFNKPPRNRRWGWGMRAPLRLGFNLNKLMNGLAERRRVVLGG